MALRGPPDSRSPAELLRFGVVNLDKPPGPTSHQVSAWARDAVADALVESGRDPIDRAAHVGTLDPKVTGSLPVLLGTATRAARVFDDAIKEYVAVLELHGPVPDDFQEVMSGFIGTIYQTPPRKSAVVRERRVRTIHDLAVLELTDRRALLRIRCDAGTYIRKLCHDMGLALGSGAHMGDLRRTGTARFDDRELVSLTDLVDALAFWRQDEPASLATIVRPAEVVLAPLPEVTIADAAAREVANGAPVYAPGVLSASTTDRGTTVACYTSNGAAVSLGTLVDAPDRERGKVVATDRVLV